MSVKLSRRGALAVLGASAAVPFAAAPAAAGDDGIVRIKSIYPFAETLARLKADIADKGIQMFIDVDQAALAKAAGIDLEPSTLLIFGNPPLGTQFIAARPEAGLDWPVRLLVFEDESGQVWMAYSDFAWIARRHAITTQPAQFDMAASVIASITASATGS